MNIIKYKHKVIELFKSGKATDEQWAEMADAILYVSEQVSERITFMIDIEICSEST